MAERVTASTFREPLLRVLGTLTGLQPGVEVHFTETFARVLADARIGEGDYGVDTQGKPQTHVWINQAFNKKLIREGLGAKGTKKGMWTLTPEGAKAASILIGTELDAFLEPSDDTVNTTLDTLDTLEDPNSPTVVANDGGEGISWSPGEMVNTYNPDPYIRGLAIKQTHCFGEFTSRSDVCESCPLSGACKAAALDRLSSIAARLQQRDEQEALRKLRGEFNPVEEEDDDDLDIDEIIDAINGTEEGGHVDLSEYKEIDVPAATKCSGCGQTLSAGEVGYYKRSVGMFHKSCVK
jgi:hypothetical protein